MVTRHCHWRNVDEWSKLNVPLSTTSNEASKMYDASLTQLISFYDDPNVGGLKSTIKAMLEADSDFVVGQCLALNLQLFRGRSTLHTSPDLQQALDHLQQQVQKQVELSPGERKHVQAVQLMADGYLKEACLKWDDILVDHPHDLMALKMSNMGYIYTGKSRQLRDGMARVLPHWSTSTPLYGNLLGMYAFGLEENNMYDQAEKTATKALEINQYDAWATHTMSHVFEMTGQQRQGIHFLDSTVNNWEECGMLSCHNWWHLALHHIELGNYEEALEIFEKQVKPRCVKRGEVFNITDAASLLFRLEMQGVKTDKHWQKIREVCQPFLEKHTLAFNDVHLVMSCLGAEDKDATQSMLASIDRLVREGEGTTCNVHRRVGQQMCLALSAYKEGDFAQVVNIVHPLRYQIISIGGSYAQLDVFNQLLIVSALQSSDKQHHKLARALLAERKALKEHSPLTDRLLVAVAKTS